MVKHNPSNPQPVDNEMEDANDFSIRNSVVTEATLVSQLANRREPEVSVMSFGIQRIDY